MRQVSILFFCISFLAACGGAKTPPMTQQQRESMLRQFVYTTEMLSEEVALHRLDSLLTATEADSAAFRFTCEYLEEPFGDPNSMYRNERLLSMVLQRMIDSPLYDSLGKLRPRQQLVIVRQNREGALSNDFAYITPDGKTGKMHDIAADYLLLMFYNPDCQACKQLEEEINASEAVTELSREARLKVLAVYVDEDTVLWRNRLGDMPEGWIVARDATGVLRNDTIYDTKAIPTIYLLDKNKRVILKDCLSIPLIENNLPVY